MDKTTYYQRNRDVALNIETYLKKARIKRENMEKIDIIICLKKIKRIPKKMSRSKK